jgi:hypothetical protein
MYDQKVVAAASASGVLAAVAILAALWRLIVGLQSVGLL